ncbi:hypothetical protein [Tenacibaculum sp. 190524A02b]|uniref:Uncharacterized protein n=1 Tax=Tenacibaculum vairaonense TaxID=3137860 RepID=A0ABP1FD42_9FLAO
MKVYELSVDFKSNKEWKIILGKNEDNRFNVISNIENDLELSLKKDERIKMHLINIESKENRKEIPFNVDIIYWVDDITLNAYSPYKGIVISEKLKKKLSNYVLPPSYFYPIDIINSITGEINNNYYLFYIKKGIVDFTLFKKSEYVYTKRRIEIKRSVGDFNTYDEFNEGYDKSYDNDGVKIKIANRCLTTIYDLIPSSLNSILVKESFLNDLSTLNGVILKERSDLFIYDVDATS